MKKKGHYRDNPQEQMETCEHCGIVLHHSGMPNHLAAHKRHKNYNALNTPASYAAVKRHKNVRANLPAKIEFVPADNNRIKAVVSLDQKALKDLLGSLKIEGLFK